jgi:hypothetical protein
MGYGVDGPGLIPGTARIFLFFTASRPALGPTHPPMKWTPVAISPGIKRPGRVASYSPPSRAPICLHGIGLN